MLIKIDQDKILWWLIPGLLTVEITILMLDALVTELGWIPIGAARRFFNITREDGISNFCTSFQMLSVGVILNQHCETEFKRCARVALHRLRENGEDNVVT